MFAEPLVIYSDFICPFCYIGKINAERLQAQLPGLQIEWREFELHPEGQPDSQSPYMRQAQAAVTALADRYGITMRPEVLTTVTSDSHRALLGLAYAREQGQESAYREAVFAAYWRDGRDIGAVDVLAGIAAAVGLDAAGFRLAITGSDYEPRLQAALDAAHRHGIEGVPTYSYGGQHLVGAQPVTALRQFVQTAGRGTAAGH